MSKSEQGDNKIVREISDMFDTYLAWFDGALAHLVYGQDEPADLPSGFETALPQGNLASLHKQVCESFDLCVEKGVNPPEKDDFFTFLKSHEAFVASFREIERRFLIGQGSDGFAGLGSPAAMKSDYTIEMERLTRNGNPFCFALVEIDGFENLKKKSGQAELDDHLKMLGALMKKSMRSFDDAYYTRENEFVMCLKQTDMAGGMAALERLGSFLARKGAGFTISACIAEPPPGEEMDVLLDNLRSDLESRGGKTDVMIEYHDISPLQRFIAQRKK